MLSTHRATRYVVPLREGGSLPAVIDTEEGGLFVVKFRGAGQGARALLAEILVAELARALELPVPEVALVELDEAFGRTEPDPEIQDILKGSRGTNFGMRYLESSFNFDPRTDEVEKELAANIVWLDAFVMNVDRTPRNPNLMWSKDRAWLIDHGASLYFHHQWSAVDEKSPRNPFENVKDHVLLPVASDLAEADERMSARLSEGAFSQIVNDLPEALLMDSPKGQPSPFSTARENREAYLRFLTARWKAPRPFLETAIRARSERRANPVESRKGYRR